MIFDKNKKTFSIEEILQVLPHQYPFVMIDKIIDIVPGERVTAIKNVSINESFFPGHFPGRPVMPGVLILESMAQAGSFLVLNNLEDPLSKGMFFTGVDKSKFRRTVVPGDQLRLEMTLQKFRLGTVKIGGDAFVDGKLVAEATLMASLVER